MAVKIQRCHYFELFLACLFYRISFSTCQTPTAMWIFSLPTTSTTVDSLAAALNPTFHLNDVKDGLGTSSRFVGNGMYFEGEQMACTDSPNGSQLRSDGTLFSVDFWVYVNDFRTDRMIVCKFVKQGGGTPNGRFCVGYDGNGRLEIIMNRNNFNSNNNFDYFTINSCQYQEGWNYVAVTFERKNGGFFGGGQYTDIKCYVITDAGTSTSGNDQWSDQINDDTGNSGYLCAGGAINNGNSGNFQLPFVGIVNQISFYATTLLSAAQVATQYSTSCESQCNICKDDGSGSGGPYPCLQTSAIYFQNYDFVQPAYPTSFVQQDNSPNTFDLTVDPNFSFTPAYAHYQGLWLDTTFSGSNQYLDSQTASDFDTAADSFTIEAWIRPTSAPTSSSTIYEKYSSVGSDYLQWGFQSSTQMTFKMNGQTMNYNTGGIALNQWHYVAVTIGQRANSVSVVCMKIDLVAQGCQDNFNSVLAESGASKTRIGSGFNGFINKLQVQDYCKEELDLIRQVETSCSDNVNGNSCSRCPADTAMCISDCGYDQYVDMATSSCLDCYASCRTCWDAYGGNCYSCPKAPPVWTYNYADTCQTSCGDGYRDDYEECDDGNTADGDGCSALCSLEGGWNCFGGSFTGKDTCYAYCGAGIPFGGGCDDGGNTNGDGCSSVCTIEKGWTCTTASTSPSTCSEICGDSLRVGSEGCDDGNTANGDGCSSTCKVETGYSCVGGDLNFKDTCKEICGDGLDFAHYGCDDGNTNNFDGCDQNCNVEVGFTCTGGTTTKKDTCTEICGDGRNFNTKANECDDGNTVNGDGCSSTCLVEAGFTCSAGSSYTKDTCVEICGDGLNKGYNKCDDGNTNAGDGCHSDCTVEIGFTCSGGTATTADTCTEICGDGKYFGSYACDDGNTYNGDGCSSTCTIESYYTCTKGDPFSASVCTKTCDGVRDFTDMCDDGNVVSGDGCDYCCHREVGYSCTGGSLWSSDSCTETCGDGRKMNILPCDDGNLVNGDGCSSTCQIESGFTCTGGSLFTPDVCSEVCGDGKNNGQYQCDDGNLSANDGCSSTCFIEDGFTCTAGNATHASKCSEICGDGLNMKSYLLDCDDGNIVSGDGCSKKCFVETGFECTQGSPFSPDICVEICGDGLNFGKHECDDGNTFGTDGCSAYCEVEPGYVCTGGSSTTPDVCTYISNPYITLAQINEANTQITLYFSEKVRLGTYWSASNELMWSIEVHGPLGVNSYEFSWNMTRQAIYKDATSAGVDKMIVDFICYNQLYGDELERIVFNFNDRSQVLSVADKTRMINTTTIIYLNGQDERNARSKIEGLPTILDNVATASTIACLGLSLIGGFLGHSNADVWLMMQSLQQAYLFPVNKLQVPSAITDFLLSLQYAMPQSRYLGYLSFGAATNYTDIQASNPAASYTYKKMGYGSNAFLYTAPDIISVFVITLFLKAVIEVLKHVFKNSKNLQNGLNKAQSSIFFGFMQYGYMKLCFTTHLNMNHLNFDDAQNSASSLLSIVIGIMLWLYLAYLGYQAYKFARQMQVLKVGYPNKTDEEKRDMVYFRGNVLFEDFNSECFNYPLTLLYPLFTCFKLIVISCLIVSDLTKTQLQGIMVMTLLSLTFSLQIQPFKDRLLNLQLIFNDMMILVIYMQAHQFIPQTTISYTDQTQVTKFLSFLVFALVGINACFVVFHKLQQLATCKINARPKPTLQFENIPALKLKEQQSDLVEGKELQKKLSTADKKKPKNSKITQQPEQKSAIQNNPQDAKPSTSLPVPQLEQIGQPNTKGGPSKFPNKAKQPTPDSNDDSRNLTGNRSLSNSEDDFSSDEGRRDQSRRSSGSDDASDDSYDRRSDYDSQDDSREDSDYDSQGSDSQYSKSQTDRSRR